VEAREEGRQEGAKENGDKHGKMCKDFKKWTRVTTKEDMQLS
jgi:hypothetical protein